MNLYETSTTDLRCCSWDLVEPLLTTPSAPVGTGMFTSHILPDFQTLVLLQFVLLLLSEAIISTYHSPLHIISPSVHHLKLWLVRQHLIISVSKGISARSFSTTGGVSHFDLRVSSPKLFLYTCWLWHPKVLLSYYLWFYWPICTKSKTISRDWLQEDQSDKPHYICLAFGKGLTISGPFPATASLHVANYLRNWSFSLIGCNQFVPSPSPLPV